MTKRYTQLAAFGLCACALIFSVINFNNGNAGLGAAWSLIFILGLHWLAERI